MIAFENSILFKKYNALVLLLKLKVIGRMIRPVKKLMITNCNQRESVSLMTYVMNRVQIIVRAKLIDVQLNGNRISMIIPPIQVLWKESNLSFNASPSIKATKTLRILIENLVK